MSILSPAFLFFLLPLALLIFHFGGRRWGESGGLAILTLFSFAFVQSQGVWFVGLFAISLIVNLAVVRLLIRDTATLRGALAMAIIINLAALAVFKYGGLISLLPGAGTKFRSLETLIPITISFLTFQRIAALIDAPAHRAALAGPIGALRFTAFASFFPNLLIGPIAYLDEVLPQLRRRDFGTVRPVNLAVGGTLIAMGLFKKAFISDQIGAAFVDPVWSGMANNLEMTSGEVILAFLGYFVQLYFDFSGYSDVAIGIARLFGIILPINFYSPFRAVGIIDFYRRWHISMTRIIARFLFTPLSIAGTRFAAQRRWRGIRMKVPSLWFPLLTNFVIIGLWHGAKPTFLVFGVIHGIWYIAETEARATRRWKSFRKTTSDRARAMMGRLIALPLLILTFSLFRAPSLTTFANLLRVARNSSVDVATVTTPAAWDFVLLIAAYLAVFLLPNSHELLSRYRPGIVTYDVASHTPGWFRWRWRPTAGWVMIMLVILLAGLYALPKAAPFSYGAF